MGYGFFRIDVCEQSPVIIQFQSSSPVHTEPVDAELLFSPLTSTIMFLDMEKFMTLFRFLPNFHVSGKFRVFPELLLHFQYLSLAICMLQYTVYCVHDNDVYMTGLFQSPLHLCIHPSFSLWMPVISCYHSNSYWTQTEPGALRD